MARIRGRPLHTATVGQRQQVVKFLSETTGPAIGLPSLRALFPLLPRCVLANLLSRYRRVWRHRYRRDGYRLEWHHPGRVWAMDHSEATQLIDGQYDQIFAVRDLGSHRQLTWSAVSGTGAEEACQVLEQLFVSHGPPLVIKSDQGSSFVSELMQELLKKWHVTPLFSPKRLPQYNGALERSNSTNKTYTHQQAVTQGHACFWTSENLAAAQALANTITRPWGHEGPSPDEAWQQRLPITAEQRHAFQTELEKQRDVARQELGLSELQELTPPQQDRLERRAISTALESLGYLSKQAVRRSPRKAKRPKRAHLQQALKQQREPEHQLNDVDADELVDQSQVDLVEMLALLATDATMQSSLGAASNASTSPNPEPTQREPANPTWLRRLITPAINAAKAAKIMR